MTNDYYQKCKMLKGFVKCNFNYNFTKLLKWEIFEKFYDIASSLYDSKFLIIVNTKI